MGDHVLLLGAARALFEAAAGLRALSRGELLVEGLPALEAIRGRVASSAPLDPPLPGTWTVIEYTTWSARLAGHDRATARSLAAEALARMQVTSMEKTRLASALPALRRATVLAAALATGATTLLVEDPTLALPDDAARPLARAFTRAASDLRTVVFGGRVQLESPVALAADEAIVVDGSDIAAQGAPAEIAASARTLAVRVLGDFDAFRRAVEERGGRLVVAPGAASSAHMRVDLGPLAARDLLRIATESNAVVVDLRPLARAFA
jgi:ABC-2 type transport system ATP-binding protein